MQSCQNLRNIRFSIPTILFIKHPFLCSISCSGEKIFNSRMGISEIKSKNTLAWMCSLIILSFEVIYKLRYLKGIFEFFWISNKWFKHSLRLWGLSDARLRILRMKYNNFEVSRYSWLVPFLGFVTIHSILNGIGIYKESRMKRPSLWIRKTLFNIHYNIFWCKSLPCC